MIQTRVQDTLLRWLRNNNTNDAKWLNIKARLLRMKRRLDTLQNAASFLSHHGNDKHLLLSSTKPSFIVNVGRVGFPVHLSPDREPYVHDMN